MTRVLIIGGGIAGLTAAFELQKLRDFEITVVEASLRLGGKLATIRNQDLLIEQGPDSIFTIKPWAMDLIEEVGLSADVISPSTSGFSMLIDGTLQPINAGLTSLRSPSPSAVAEAHFLTDEDKRRVLSGAQHQEEVNEDESISSFFTRRYGAQFCKLIAEPLLAGVHAGDPRLLSMKALYPTYLADQIESPKQQNHPPFVTLKNGMASLVDCLKDNLSGIKLMPNTPIVSLDGSQGQLSALTDQGKELRANHVILAIPAFAASDLLGKVSPQSARLLAASRFVSTAVVTLAYARSAFGSDLKGTGFLVPYSEPCKITGCTWSSNKWKGRAPSDTVLMRAFLGRDGQMCVDDFSDQEVAGMAKQALATILSPKSQPIMSRVDRWQNGMPQYELGHLERMAAIENALSRLQITLIGSSYRGNSISDCVRQGKAAASMLARSSDVN